MADAENVETKEPPPEQEQKAAAPQPSTGGDSSPPRQEPSGETIAAGRNEGSVSAAVSVGDSAKFRDIYTITNIGKRADDEESHEVPISTMLSSLPPLSQEELSSVRCIATEIRQQAEILRKERTLLIRCGNAAVARAAESALIDLLGLPPQRRKLLDFDKAERLRPKAQLHVVDLLGKPIDPEGDVVILADAGRSGGARTFVDSLFSFGGHWKGQTRLGDLREAGVLLICGTHQEEDRVASGEAPPVATWTVPTLHVLLEPHFPDTYREVAQKIRADRAKGRWSSDLAEFYRQVALMDREQLSRAVETPVDDDADALLPRDQPLHLAVLYVATFYPGLSPHEFSSVVTTLVRERTGLFLEPVRQKAKDGTFKEVELRHEKKLADVWSARADAVLHECGLNTARDTTRTIEFAEPRRRERLRKQFDETFGVYVRAQFETAYEHKLLLGASKRVAEDVIALTIAMAQDYPAEFGVDWLYRLVVDEWKGNVDWPRLVQSRVIALLRAMLDDAALSGVVAALLRSLIGTGEHLLAFEILQKIRFAPGFDVFPWLRQLVEQGREEVRDLVYLSLFIEMGQHGRAWPLIEVLSGWLTSGREKERETQADQLVPRLVVEFCVDATMRFDPRRYGAWPSPFPLFALTAESAESRLRLLIGFLLKPGMSVRFNEPPVEVHITSVLAPLIAEWTRILLGPPDADGEVEQARPDDAALGAAEVVAILVRELAVATNTAGLKPLQAQLPALWEAMKAASMSPASKDFSGPDGSAARQEYARSRHERGRQRALLVTLIVKFREAVRALPVRRRYERVATP